MSSLLDKFVHYRTFQSAVFAILGPVIYLVVHWLGVGRDSLVGIMTRYGLDGPVIESRWGRDFLHLSRPALGPPSLQYNGYRVFFRDKAPGAWLWPPTPSTTEVKERVELYLYSPPGPSWPLLGWNLPLPLPMIGINSHKQYSIKLPMLGHFCFRILQL